MLVVEHSEVRYGRTLIPYSIRRSARRGTVAVAVEPSGEVLLTAPTSTPVERLDRVVHDKARWIVARRQRAKALPIKLPAKEFITGETFHYLGRQYRLRVREGAPGVRLHRGCLEVSVDGPKHKRAERVRAALVGWYKVQAGRRLDDRVAAWAEKIGVDVPKVLVREQQKRWASCDNKGVLRFNWRMIQASSAVVDYVVVHELVHLRHRHHGSAFWSVVGRAMPEYEARRAVLARSGSCYHW